MFCARCGLVCRGSVDTFLLLGVHFGPRRVVAVHDHRPFTALLRHILLIRCEFGVWQDTLGEDEFLGHRMGREQPTHVGQVTIGLADLADQFVGKVIDLPGLLPRRAP